MPDEPRSADYDAIIRRIEERNIALVERTHPHFGGLPICPFAQAARLKKTIKYIVRPFDLNDDLGSGSFIVREIDVWLGEPGWEMLWFIDPDTSMPYGPYISLYARFAAYVATRACHGFAGHRDHPYEIAGMRLQNEDYPNLQVITDGTMQTKRRKLRHTRYYDSLTPEELALVFESSLQGKK